MRFFGVVGYGLPQEDPPGSGIWVDAITEQNYYGDVFRQSRDLATRSIQEGFSTNEDIRVSDQIGIIADQFAIDNFLNIKYVKWMGVRWTVTNVSVDRPRLTLSLGSVYNGPIPT